MKLVLPLLAISISLVAHHGLDAQWNTIEELEKTGFRIDPSTSVSESDGVRAIRWRIEISEQEMEMLGQQTAKLETKYDEAELEQGAIREKLANLGVSGSVEDRLKEINAGLSGPPPITTPLRTVSTGFCAG